MFVLAFTNQQIELQIGNQLCVELCWMLKAKF